MIIDRFKNAPAAVDTLNRRQFLKLGTAAGLVLGIQLPLGRALASAAPAAALEPNAFIRISPDDWVTVVIKHHEMGQGATTGLATLVADELDADWSRVRPEYAGADDKLYANLYFGAQGTGGSTSIANSWEQMRRAGATARAMLTQAAAQAWGVPLAEVQASNGVLSHASGKSARYGEMAERAGGLPVPADVTLKTPEQFTLIGKRKTPRLDSLGKSTGRAQYTTDVKLDGLLTAVIARPPMIGARLKSFDAKAAKGVVGVTDVVEVPEGVAVVARGMWEAMEGRKALQLEWELPAESERMSSEALYTAYRAMAKKPGLKAAQSPNTAAELAKSASTLQAVYAFPYLAHAPMEPLNCVAWLHDGMLETWSGHQFPSFDHRLAAEAAGLPPDKVVLHTLVSGGSFGRRANASSDFVVEAVHVAKAIGGRAPVRVQRTREDDMHAQYYRPLYVHDVRVGLDENSAVRAWQHHIVGQSIAAGTPMEAVMLKEGIDETSVEGVEPTLYEFPARTVELSSPAQPLKVLWWRSVGHTHTAYVMETLMDELAEKAGQDALKYRLDHLSDTRMAGVLKLVADKAGWGGSLPEGRARGIAGHFSFNTYVAQVAEVELGKDGLPQVKRVVVAVDCGVPVNPDQIVAQMEGGIGFALAAALYGDLDIADGKIKQANFDTYKVLRMPEMPKVEVHIVASSAAPTGVGEPGVPPLAPAVANALYQLTGERVRRLPFAHGASGRA